MMSQSLAIAPPVSAKKERLSYLDYLRGIAALWMIEVHIVDICLADNLKQGTFYDILNISNGFVAVCFIFCAGAGFQLAFEKKAADFRSFSAPLWQYLKRLGHILILAYWLHLPAFSLQRTLQASPEELLRMFECDVLHNIVYSSLIALVIGLVIPNRRALLWIFGVLTLFFFFATPYIWAQNPFEVFPTFFATCVAKQPISKFPFFPFSGYFFAGAVLTSLFTHVQNKRTFAVRGALIAFMLPILLFFLKYSPFDFPGHEDWWHSSPGHALYRTSIIVLVMCLLYLFQERIDRSRFSNALRLCGQESLFFYIFHLMLVYGTIANFGLVYLASHRYSYWETGLVLVVITAVTYSLASMWNSYKRNEAKKASHLVFWLMALFMVIFLLVPSYLAGR